MPSSAVSFALRDEHEHNNQGDRHHAHRSEIQAVARVLHELVTNAAKHGALSMPGGHVSVNWDRKPNGDGANLMLVWQEHGGPPVKSEVQSSYGTNLIRNLIPHELGGKIDLVLASEGVSCKLDSN